MYEVVLSELLLLAAKHYACAERQRKRVVVGDLRFAFALYGSAISDTSSAVSLQHC
jgi:hypothetical protein